MKLLLDECVTRSLRRDLAGMKSHTVRDAGLKGLENGELLKAAAGVYDVLVTVDQNLLINRIWAIYPSRSLFLRQAETVIRA